MKKGGQKVLLFCFINRIFVYLCCCNERGCLTFQAEIKPFELDPDNAGAGSLTLIPINGLIKKIVMKKIMLILFLDGWGIFIFSQVNLSGLVTDEKGQVLPGANVVLSGTYLGTVTNEQGYFFFRKVPAGNYILKVSFVGFETRKERIHLIRETNLSISLKYSAILTDEVFVTGVRADAETPVTFSNVSREKIAEKNLGQDIPYLIKTLPSVVVTSDAGAGVGYTAFRIRGSDLTRINVTMNGIPLNDSEDHGVWWVDMPDFASSVTNIQVQRGVGTSTNGAGAFGASVNFQTFSLQPQPYAEISSSAGSYNTFKNTIRLGTGLLKKRFSFDARVSKISSDGYIERASSDLKSLALTSAYYSRKNILRLVFMRGYEKTYQAWDGVPGDMLKVNRRYNGIGEYTDENGNTRYYNNETDNYWQDHLQLFYSKEFSPSLYLNLAAHYTKGKGYYEQYKENSKLGDYLLQDVIIGNDTLTTTDIIRQKWLDNDFYGLIYNLKFIKIKWNLDVGGSWNKYNGGHFGRVIWARFFSDGEKDHHWYDNLGIKTDYNVYGKMNYNLFPGGNLYFDMQVRGIGYRMSGQDDDQRELTQNHHYLFFNPKAGLTYKLSDRISVYGSFAVAHREPSRYDFKDAPVNGPEPRPEILRDVETGAEWRARNATFHANMYYMRYKDQLVMTGKINDVGVPIMTNVPVSYRLGLELQAMVRVSRKLSWEGNTTFSKNEILNFTEYVDDWDTWSQRPFYLGITDLSFSPEAVANSSLKYQLLKSLDLQWLAKYVGKQYIDNTASEERKLDPYFVNDLLVTLKLKSKTFKSVQMTAMVNNLFNAKYETNAWVYQYYEGEKHKVMNGYFPQAGIHYLLGANLKF